MRIKKGNSEKIGLQSFKIGLGWDPSIRPFEEFDLDVSAFILGKDGKALNDDYIVYYNSENRILPSDFKNGKFIFEPYNAQKYPDYELDYREKTRPVSPNFEVIGSLDDKTGRVSDGDDDEDMYIDLKKLDQRAEQIVIVVSIYDADDKMQNFSRVENAQIRVVNPLNDEEIIKYELQEYFGFETAVEFGRIFKSQDGWKFEAIGEGTNLGLEFYDKKYSK